MLFDLMNAMSNNVGRFLFALSLHRENGPGLVSLMDERTSGHFAHISVHIPQYKGLRTYLFLVRSATNMRKI